jgi:SpoVK/Ycf46/Vps4 family AAA+-type ATPase
LTNLPSAAARAAAFEIHFDKRQLFSELFDVPHLAHLTEGFSGAEIEQAVIGARYRAHAENKPLEQKHLEAELAATRPLSVVMAEKVQALRDWASARCVPAD